MKRLNNIIKIVILASLLSSCSREKKIQSIFIGKKNEYWKYQNYCLGTKGIYFQFRENGTHDKYLLYIDSGFTLFNDDGDLKSGPRTWSIKNDSIFIFDENEYTIEKINNKEILLSYPSKKNKECFVKLQKWKDSSNGAKEKDSSNKL